ncbi:hypothetical protein FQR65_LT18789 [Abscondita terminalis]|nr:hypothetical protein FQR65_LT18789 [Abscondita terminalis]
MKLEEKRRHIETEKRRMEVIMSKQRQKVGKAAFLQAVTKGKGNILKTPTESETSSTPGSEPRSPASDKSAKNQRPFTLQVLFIDITTLEDVSCDMRINDVCFYTQKSYGTSRGYFFGHSIPFLH